MVTTIFNNEESLLINNICRNEEIFELTRDKVIQSLRFSQQIASKDDTLVSDLIDSTLAKMESLSDFDWEALRMHIPFPVSLYAEDEVSEVPEDEE